MPVTRLADDLFAEWVDWLDRIRTEVIQLHHHRQIWREMRDAIVDRAPDTPGTFLQHYTKLYVDTQVVAVRRVAHGSRSDEISLLRLIRAIQTRPDVITRDRYLGLMDPDLGGHFREICGEHFDRAYGDASGGDALDPAKLQGDLRDLDDECTKIIAMANKMVAHLGDTPPSHLPRFDELDRAIDHVGEVFKKYSLLLTGSSWYSLAPTIQDDWKATFRRPLFEPIGRLDPGSEQMLDW